MSQTPRFINPQAHTVQVFDENKNQISIHPWSKRDAYPGSTFVVDGEHFRQFAGGNGSLQRHPDTAEQEDSFRNETQQSVETSPQSHESQTEQVVSTENSDDSGGQEQAATEETETPTNQDDVTVSDPDVDAIESVKIQHDLTEDQADELSEALVAYHANDDSFELSDTMSEPWKSLASHLNLDPSFYVNDSDQQEPKVDPNYEPTTYAMRKVASEMGVEDRESKNAAQLFEEITQQVSEEEFRSRAKQHDKARKKKKKKTTKSNKTSK